MTKTVSIGSPPIEVHLRRSARAKRYSLRIANSDGKVSLTLPNRASEHAALDFARRQEGWLRVALGKRPPVLRPAQDQSVLYLGQKIAVQQGHSRSVTLTEAGLLIPGPPEMMGAKLKGFFRVQARHKLAEASEKYAARLGRKIGQITLRDTTSRWGSCTSSGNLMFSWRLIMAPPAVLDYVAAHEVAHLIEMNHSAAFWQVVAGLMPDYQTHRRWLKAHGTKLHQIHF